MFVLDLKSLMQVSNAMKKPTLMHKRIRCGKAGYLVCYILHDGRLTVQRVRHVRSGQRKRSLKRCNSTRIAQLECIDQYSQTSSAHDTKDCDTQCSMECEVPEAVQLMNVATETEQPEFLDCSVNTVSVTVPVSRHQQTNIISLMTTCSQTRKVKLEIRSTQVELHLKSRSTECSPDQRRTISVQTKSLVQLRQSFAQTTPESEKDMEEEANNGQNSVLNIIMASIGHQSEMLFSCLQSLQQLIEFKELELEKQRLVEVQATVVTVTVATQVPEPELQPKSSETGMQLKKPIKVMQLTVKRAQARNKHRYRLHMQRNSKTKGKTWQGLVKPRRSEAQMQTQTEPTPTDLQWTQTEKVICLVASTQTGREKRFLWLRHRN